MFAKGQPIVFLIILAVIISVGVKGQDPHEYFDQNEVYDEQYDDFDDYNDHNGAKEYDNTLINSADNDIKLTTLIEDLDILRDPRIIFNDRMRGLQNGMDAIVEIMKEIAGNLDCEDAGLCSAPFQIVRSGECLYFNLDNYKTWSAAREYCQALGADLAEPVTIRQDLEYIMSISAKTMNYMSHDRLWVGASDIDKEGVWRWLSGRLVTQDIGWTINHPRDITGREDCLAMIFTHPPSVKALSCNTRKPFVCQKLM